LKSLYSKFVFYQAYELVAYNLATPETFNHTTLTTLTTLTCVEFSLALL